MRTSEHFNLNLVEGSDVVNPLVQDVPNYETIDEAMFDNKSASVGVATELKSGTVHALTRLNTDAAMFRFKATSRFGVGETFTVDGIQVTALLPDGSPLEDGAYIIGSTVLCSLVETLLTVYTTRTTAEDTYKFDGHTSDYYATKAALDEVDNTATAAGALASQVSSNLLKKPSFVDYSSYETAFEKTSSTTETWTAPNNCYVVAFITNSTAQPYGYISISIDGMLVANDIVRGDLASIECRWSGYIKQGQTISFNHSRGGQHKDRVTVADLIS